MIKVKRIYEPDSPEDGFRVLVDRLWPRGLTKEKADIGLWLKEVAPSTELRKWFAHDPKKWNEFEKRYRRELLENRAVVDQLKELEERHANITLLYGAKDITHNEAIVLANFLQKK